MEGIFHIIVATVVVISAIVEFCLYRISVKNKKEMEKYKNDVVLSTDLGRVLVIYFSVSGVTKDIAYHIMQITYGNIYEIRTVKDLVGGPFLYASSWLNLATGRYPGIIKDFPDISSYDTIFIGTPVWWDTIATPVSEYLKNTDFHGKYVVPFATQRTKSGHTLKDFEKQIKNARLLKGESFNKLNNKFTANVRNKITNWINNLKSDNLN